MNNQKICISKQNTFISVIAVLLLTYVLVAYRTMTTTTSTNSRAVEAPTLAISVSPSPIILPPSCPHKCSFVKPIISGDNSVQFLISPESLTTTRNKIYDIFKYDKVGSILRNPQLVNGLKALKSETISQMNFNSSKISAQDLLNKKFILFEMPVAGERSLEACRKLSECDNN